MDYSSSSTRFKFKTQFAKYALMESHLLSVSHSLPAALSLHVWDIELWTIQRKKKVLNKLKKIHHFLRNDNRIHRLETEEVTGCQQEHVEEAEEETHIVEKWQSRTMVFYSKNKRAMFQQWQTEKEISREGKRKK